MITNRYNVIGVMSGTSLDGVDLVYTKFEWKKKWSFKIECAITVPYNQYWNSKLRSLAKLNRVELNTLDDEYTFYLAGIINDFITEYEITEIDFISSHGHTALHQPENGITYQIGNRESIVSYVSFPVICDFRTADVALGGQGAPLVPIGDRILFTKYDYCLNLGGFSNVSYEDAGLRIAFDICPVNIVMNHYSRQIGLEYDKNGILASKGKICDELLKKLNNLSFFKDFSPKSLGLEWVTTDVLPLIDSFELCVEDILRTYSEHIAIQISGVLKLKDKVVLVTGGGVYNSFLMSRLTERSKSLIEIPSRELVEFKEALIFAFLGVLKIRGEVNCLKSVTGASQDHSSGIIFYPKNSN